MTRCSHQWVVMWKAGDEFEQCKNCGRRPPTVKELLERLEQLEARLQEKDQ